MAAESNQMIRMASSLDRNSQRDLDVEAFAGGSRYHGADGTPLYPVQSTQINVGYENPSPRYSVRSPQRPQRVYGNHPFRHSTNSHGEENTPVQHISGSLRTRASDNNVTRRPEPAELQPTAADATKSTPSLTKLFNTTIISACLITMVTSWDHQGNFDKHTRRAKWAIQVILIQLGFLIYQYLIIRVLPQVDGDEDAEAFRGRCVMSRSLKTAVGAIFWLVWGTVVFAAY